VSSSNQPIKFELKRLTELNKTTIAAELRRVAAMSSSPQLSFSYFKKLGGRVSQKPILRLFGSWETALKHAGLEHMFTGSQPTKQGIIHRNQTRSNEELIAMLRGVAEKLGKVEITKDEAEQHSEIRYGSIQKRFGSWKNALNVAGLQQRNLGRRDIRLGLRFAILQRDRFRCVTCGSSPATHSGCVLHVDHVLPFSKGGKTRLDNLRTLCADCNVGRGNRFEE